MERDRHLDQPLQEIPDQTLCQTPQIFKQLMAFEILTAIE
jgi:hypothetical protein